MFYYYYLFIYLFIYLFSRERENWVSVSCILIGRYKVYLCRYYRPGNSVLYIVPTNDSKIPFTPKGGRFCEDNYELFTPCNRGKVINSWWVGLR